MNTTEEKILLTLAGCMTAALIAAWTWQSGYKLALASVRREAVAGGHAEYIECGNEDTFRWLRHGEEN